MLKIFLEECLLEVMMTDITDSVPKKQKITGTFLLMA